MLKKIEGLDMSQSSPIVNGQSLWMDGAELVTVCIQKIDGLSGLARGTVVGKSLGVLFPEGIGQVGDEFEALFKGSGGEWLLVIPGIASWSRRHKGTKSSRQLQVEAGWFD